MKICKDLVCPQRKACALVPQNPDKVIKGNYKSLLFVKLSARVYYLMFMMKYKTAKKKIDMRERERVPSEWSARLSVVVSY